MDGMQSSRIDILAPKIDVKNPNVMIPPKAPILLIDPSHDSSSFEIGPDFSGVSSDIKIGNVGDNHPFIYLKKKKRINLDHKSLKSN